jgi:ribosomal protein L44E
VTSESEEYQVLKGKREKVKGHYRYVERDSSGKIVSAKKWTPKKNKQPRYWLQLKCHDCDASVGQLHILGCDMETCPICGGQLISCSEEHFKLVEEGKFPRIPYIQPLVQCAACNLLFPDMFQVPDEEWDKYVIPPLQHEFLCWDCYGTMKELFPNGWRNICE